MRRRQRPKPDIRWSQFVLNRSTALGSKYWSCLLYSTAWKNTWNHLSCFLSYLQLVISISVNNYQSINLCTASSLFVWTWPIRSSGSSTPSIAWKDIFQPMKIALIAQFKNFQMETTVVAKCKCHDWQRFGKNHLNSENTQISVTQDQADHDEMKIPGKWSHQQ